MLQRLAENLLDLGGDEVHLALGHGGLLLSVPLDDLLGLVLVLHQVVDGDVVGLRAFDQQGARLDVRQLVWRQARLELGERLRQHFLRDQARRAAGNDVVVAVAALVGVVLLVPRHERRDHRYGEGVVVTHGVAHRQRGGAEEHAGVALRAKRLAAATRRVAQRRRRQPGLLVAEAQEQLDQRQQLVDVTVDTDVTHRRYGVGLAAVALAQPRLVLAECHGLARRQHVGVDLRHGADHAGVVEGGAHRFVQADLRVAQRVAQPVAEDGQVVVLEHEDVVVLDSLAKRRQLRLDGDVVDHPHVTVERSPEVGVGDSHAGAAQFVPGDVPPVRQHFVLSAFLAGDRRLRTLGFALHHGLPPLCLVVARLVAFQVVGYPRRDEVGALREFFYLGARHDVPVELAVLFRQVGSRHVGVVVPHRQELKQRLVLVDFYGLVGAGVDVAPPGARLYLLVERPRQYANIVDRRRPHDLARQRDELHLLEVVVDLLLHRLGLTLGELADALLDFGVAEFDLRGVAALRLLLHQTVEYLLQLLGRQVGQRRRPHAVVLLGLWPEHLH